MTSRIVSFSARDVLRLSAVQITPTGNVITLGGKNGAGKSRVLNAIEMALAGKRATPEKPIREGAERASVVLDLGDLIVERVITASSDRLVVKSPDGATYPRPQEMLNKLFSSIAFDPLKFATQPAAEQAETLRRLTGLDLTALDQERAEIYAERTEAGREFRALTARLESMPQHEDAPTEEVSVATLAQELSRREDRVRKGDKLRRVVRDRIDDVRREETKLTETRARLVILEAQLAAHKAYADDHAQQILGLKQAARDAKAEADAFEAPDPREVRAQLASAEAVNRKVRENAARAALQHQVTGAGGTCDGLTEKIADLDQQKHAALAAVKFPGPGLSLTDDGVTFNGIPFAQSSKAEQLRVSLAVGIAQNPELRVLFVRDGSLLDTDGLRLIGELAAEHDCQVWLEDARTQDPTAVIIEDGHVKQEGGTVHAINKNQRHAPQMKGSP